MLSEEYANIVDIFVFFSSFDNPGTSEHNELFRSDNFVKYRMHG